MNTHPTHDELFDAAAEGAPGPHAAHLAGCDSCRAAYDRLRAGAALLDDARADDGDLDAIDWGRLDGAIQSAAEQAAADIRSGKLRAPRPWASYAAGVVALAAAAVGVVYVKSRPAVDAPAPVAMPTPSPTPAPVAQPAVAFEGAVLLAAGGATQTPSGAAAPVRFSGGAGVREGARVETGAAGRAVFAVQPAVTLDVRPDSDATLTAMRVDTTAVTLARGELAVDREGDVGAVAVRSGRWNISLEGDATVRATSSLVRVVVLAGRATATAEGGAVTSFSGPVVLELPAAAGDARSVPGDAVDAMRLNLAPLPARGTLWQMPAVDPAATVSLRGHGALPASIEALRLGGPATLEARVGRQVFTLEVGSGRVLEWHRNAAVAANTAGQRPAPTAAALPSPATAPAPEGRDLSAAEVNAMSRSINARMRHCFTRCVETNQCREPHGTVEFSVTADGATSLGSVDPSVANARACLAHEAQFVRFPATGGAFPFQITVR